VQVVVKTLERWFASLQLQLRRMLHNSSVREKKSFSSHQEPMVGERFLLLHVCLLLSSATSYCCF